MSHLKHLIQLGVLAISGPGAHTFLQGQLTCDLNEITATTSKLAAHCNPKGRIISLFRIALHQGNYLLIMPRALLSTAIQALANYSKFFKIEMRDASERFYLYYSDASPEITALATSCLIIKPFPIERYLVVNDTPLNLSTTKNDDDWQHDEICSKIPNLTAKTSGMFLPHELNLPALGAVSFKKGCYTGQEIIARLHYLGKLKKTLVLALIPSEFRHCQPGDSVWHHNQAIGLIVSISDERALLLLDDPFVEADKISLAANSNHYLTW